MNWLRRVFQKRIMRVGLLVAIGCALGVAIANVAIVERNRARLFSDLGAVPFREVGLVLGTSPVTSSGKTNLHFAYRIEAAAALYHAGKVRHLLVSGDNHRADYDEPSAMKRALVARGVPAEAITCDYAGFRTLDSVVRARCVFGLGECTIVSQRYHNTRALEIARAQEIDAVAFCTREVPAVHALRTEVREVLARAMTVLDLYVWHRGPHFAGPYEPILVARE
jgi:SanA protein